MLNVQSSFLKENDLSEWKKLESYNEAKNLCLAISVVNDSAERAVALGQTFNTFGPKDENQKAALLANVFVHRKSINTLTKTAVIKHTVKNE